MLRQGIDLCDKWESEHSIMITENTSTLFTCGRCFHSWQPRRPGAPRVCPKCKSPYWNKPRVFPEGHGRRQEAAAAKSPRTSNPRTKSPRANGKSPRTWKQIKAETALKCEEARKHGKAVNDSL